MILLALAAAGESINEMTGMINISIECIFAIRCSRCIYGKVAGQWVLGAVAWGFCG